MRTTVSIDDNLLKTAKARAKARGITLGQFIGSALQHELSERATSFPGPEIPVFRDGTGPRPGIDLRSNRAMLESLEEDLDLVDRR